MTIDLQKISDGDLNAAVAVFVARRAFVSVPEARMLAPNDEQERRLRDWICPDYLHNATACIELLDGHWHAAITHDATADTWAVSLSRAFGNCGHVAREQPTFNRAACIALLRAAGVECVNPLVAA